MISYGCPRFVWLVYLLNLYPAFSPEAQADLDGNIISL